ncbi:hypothetical protein MA16_Dca005003 [Dendrobium catenatum]|uniref:Uncharacterized protein n=1 Tax=Dendrobium catenatum TaxID=906689 RepID=A0A2I0WGP1_9ASPA|nr:hypothetical protein MA16_Dca005003 [Dendrobium catenatum]
MENDVNLSGCDVNCVDVAVVLSPDAKPFISPDFDLGSLKHNVVSPRVSNSADGLGCAGPMLSVVSVPARVVAGNSLHHVVLGCPNESILVSDNLGGGVCEGSANLFSKSTGPSSSPPVMNDCFVNNNFVDVPITLINPQCLVYHVGENSGLDVRVQLDWLHGSSDSDSVSLESIGDDDPGNSFALLHDKSLLCCLSWKGSWEGQTLLVMMKLLVLPSWFSWLAFWLVVHGFCSLGCLEDPFGDGVCLPCCFMMEIHWAYFLEFSDLFFRWSGNDVAGAHFSISMARGNLWCRSRWDGCFAYLSSKLDGLSLSYGKLVVSANL